MTKKEFVKRLARQTDLTLEKSAEVYGALFDAKDGIISNSLAENEDVSIPGFGKFSSVKQKARVAMNPSTGAKIQVPEKNKIKFTVSKTLKERVN